MTAAECCLSWRDTWLAERDPEQLREYARQGRLAAEVHADAGRPLLARMLERLATAAATKATGAHWLDWYGSAERIAARYDAQREDKRERLTFLVSRHAQAVRS